jgi:nucleoside-diphosphate-sugar epimerase
MKILVLGGSGHIGKHLLALLRSTPWAEPTGASRQGREQGLLGETKADWVSVDTTDVPALTAALRGFDAVVNCVAGDARSIFEGARALAQAARAAHCRRIIHMSTMAVYGPVEGIVREDTPLNPSLGWYGQAKCQAENEISEFVRQGGEAVVLRPGCVFGPGSDQWVGRVARWLQAGRLGDLGVAGDGWSNLVDVADVCHAIAASLSLSLKPGELPIFNLAAPDSPRWNDYFVDLALALKLTPVRRIGPRQLLMDARLAGPALKIAQRVAKYLRIKNGAQIPDPMPAGLLRLWSQQIHLDADAATQALGLSWTPYAISLPNAAAWVCGRAPSDAQTIGRTAYTL